MVKLLIGSDKMFKQYKKIIIIAIIILVVLALASFITCIVLTPKLYLTDKDIDIEVNTEYKEPGYKSYVINKDITDKVKVKSNLNTDKVGNYTITYEIKYLIFNVKKTRTIRVVDKEYPAINLNGKEEVTVCPNTKYTEEGFSASDNYDGDLTKKVERIEKDNEIIYSVKDTFGNLTTKKRKLIHEDKEPPTIRLNGYNNMTIYLGSTFRDPGYEVTDNCDSNVANKIDVSGSVNPNQIGVYVITYKVTDDAGNTTEVKRTINVIYQNITHSGTIYLTFDDGPSSTITGKILDILKEENIKATFFVINKSDNLNYLIKREYDEGHTVGLHSYSHNYADVYSSNNAYLDDLNKISKKVNSITGINSKIIRFPGGSSNTVSKNYTKGVMSYLTREVTKQGYRYFDWNVSAEDAAGAKSSTEVYNNVISNLRHNRINVVLMHDFENNYYTLNALRKIIQYGKNNGYTFSNITMNTPQITHGVNN